MTVAEPLRNYQHHSVFIIEVELINFALFALPLFCPYFDSKIHYFGLIGRDVGKVVKKSQNCIPQLQGFHLFPNQ